MAEGSAHTAAGPLVLAIDLGTGGPKVALYDTAARLVDSAFEPVETRLLTGGGAEQDPQEWWQAIRRASARLEASARQRVAWVACTGQWSGTVPLDKEGRVLYPCLTWMDSRGAPWVRQLMHGWPAVSGYGLARVLRWIKITGGAPSLSGKDPVGHILWLKAHKPDIFEATCTFLEPVDYLNYRLTGRRCASYDSITVHWVTDNRQLRNVKYHEGLLKTVGLPMAKLPELVPTGTWIGGVRAEAAGELGISTEAKVLTACGDIHSAAVGSGATEDYVPHLYIGTSSWLIAHIPKKLTDLRNNMGTLPAALPGRYILANEQETAGRCLQFLRDHLFFDKDSLGTGEAPPDFYARLDEVAAQSPPGSEGLLFFPWLNGERTPYEDHRMRGCFFNLDLRHRRRHVARSVLEGVALNARLVLEALNRHFPSPVKVIHMIGGGAISSLWCQIVADVMGVRVHQMAQPQQCNTRGVAMLALLAAGKISRQDLGGLAPIHSVFTPGTEYREVYEPLFKVFKSYYARNKKFWQQLNTS